MDISFDKTGTLRAQEHGHQPLVATFPGHSAHALRAQSQLSFRADQDNLVLQLYKHHPQDSRVVGPCKVADTVTARYGTGGGTLH